jgi:hypothetical protein
MRSLLGLPPEQPRYDGPEELARRALAVVERGRHQGASVGGPAPAQGVLSSLGLSFSLSNIITYPQLSQRTRAMKSLLPRCGSPTAFSGEPPMDIIPGHGKTYRDSRSQTGKLVSPSA